MPVTTVPVPRTVNAALRARYVLSAGGIVLDTLVVDQNAGSGAVIFLDGGQINIAGGITNNTGGTLSGNGTINFLDSPLVAASVSRVHAAPCARAIARPAPFQAIIPPLPLPRTAFSAMLAA